MAQGLVGVLGDGPDLGDVFLAKTAGDHVDDSAAKSRRALAGSDHERADVDGVALGLFDAEVHDVIEQPADVLCLLSGDVFPAGVGRGLQIHIVGWEAGFFVGGEFHMRMAQLVEVRPPDRGSALTANTVLKKYARFRLGV